MFLQMRFSVRLYLFLVQVEHNSKHQPVSEGIDGIVWQPICSQNLLQPKCSQNLLQSLRVVWRTASGVTVAPGNVVAEKLLGYIRSIVCCRRTEHSFSGPFGAIYVRSQTLP